MFKKCSLWSLYQDCFYCWSLVWEMFLSFNTTATIVLHLLLQLHTSHTFFYTLYCQKFCPSFISEILLFSHPSPSPRLFLPISRLFFTTFPNSVFHYLKTFLLFPNILKISLLQFFLRNSTPPSHYFQKLFFCSFSKLIIFLSLP